MDGGETRDLAEVLSHFRLRALVTRPRAEAESLAAALAMRGVGAIIEPLVQVHFRDGAAPDLAGVQAILCTSANGVRAFARVAGERRVPLLAVGDATAARARAEGFTDVVSAGGTVADLVRLAVARLRPEAGRLLHVSGDVVAGDLAGALRKEGFAIERRVTYEARPAAALGNTAIRAMRAGMIDFALFLSPRTAGTFVRLAGIAGVARCCAGITALSISAAADAALAALRWRARHVAEQPHQQALLDLLDGVLAKRQQG